MEVPSAADPPRSDGDSSVAAAATAASARHDTKLASPPGGDASAREDHRRGGSNSKGGRNKGKRNRHNKQQQHSLDHLKRRVSALMAAFEEHGLFLPPPDDISEKKGKVWSNRNYGQDKKRQRKATERVFLEGRIAQLEACLAGHDPDLLPED